MKKLPLGISSFKKLISNNELYIDKTADIYKLINSTTYLFLSRPRRFGKSLLISTLEEIFLGNKELFKDLYIYNTDYDWQKYPVIKLDFSTMDLYSLEEFKKSVLRDLNAIRKLYNIEPNEDLNISNQIKYLVEDLSKINKVVILIDEYDSPILNSINNLEKMEDIRGVLRSFYNTIKGLDAYIHKFFMTGITKIAQTSLFSGSNQVSDISQLQFYQSILGYTQEELEYYFKYYIKIGADLSGISIIDFELKVKKIYNGYRFAKSEITVYNPFSILSFFQSISIGEVEFLNYWIRTAVSEYLIYTARKNILSLINITDKLISNKHILIDQAGLESFSATSVPLDSLLFQTGYLTISGHNGKDYEIYYPNEEVKEALEKYLLLALTTSTTETIDTNIRVLRNGLRNNSLTSFFSELTKLIIDLPFDLQIELERYYHSIIHIIAYLSNFKHITEEHTHSGILDLNIETENFIFLFEFKINKTAQEALNQIEEKKYYLKYLDSEKPVTIVGASFNKVDNSTVIDWKSVPLNEFIQSNKKW